MIVSDSFTRQELYERVWATPMTKLAEELSLPAAQLREACRAAAIPTPSSGYWIQRDFGKASPSPLGEPPDATWRASRRLHRPGEFNGAYAEVCLSPAQEGYVCRRCNAKRLIGASTSSFRLPILSWMAWPACSEMLAR